MKNKAKKKVFVDKGDDAVEKSEDDQEFVDDTLVKKAWYDEIVADPEKYDHAEETLVNALKSEAKVCLSNETINHEMKNSKNNSDYQWMKTVMSKGTISDKIAAYTVTIQDNPVCSLESIKHLIGMVKTGKKNDCIIVVDALTDLFINDLLNRYRKLKYFQNRPLALLNELSSGNTHTRKKLLTHWYFEDQLKDLYASYIEALTLMSRDSVDNKKEKAVNALYKLLEGNSELDKKLLNLLVNKLGDPSRKVASKVIYCLSQLLNKQSNMQGPVLNEIERLLFRSNIAAKAQYYSLCFLTQFYLSNEGSDIARHLIELYFSFFKACVKKGEVDTRMMGALLVGTKRAFPYAKLEMEKISEHVNTLYKVVHIANFNVGIHALALLYQVSDFSNNINDRFYSALYKKLLDPQIANSNHQAVFLSLVFKALSKDRHLSRIKVFLKRLLQLALYVLPSMACGILYLVSQLLSKNSKLYALRPDMQQIVTEQTDEQEEEVSPILNIEVAKEEEDKKDIQFRQSYDGYYRNPRYAGGEFCLYYELQPLKTHFHPSVALFAQQILRGERIVYGGDPLKDFTLIRFLDRFVFKNPKKADSNTETTGCHPVFGKRKLYAAGGLKSLPVKSGSYLSTAEKNIPVDELFLYKFLQSRGTSRSEKEDRDDSDLESVCSEEFEDMLDKMGGKMKDVEEVDYMDEIGDSLKHVTEEQANPDGEEGSVQEEEEDDDYGDDDENDESLMAKDSDLENLSEDDDASDIQFSSDEELDTQPKRKKQKKDDMSSLFASAEEFSTLLEEEGTSKKAPGSLHAFANKDKADLKQISWEEQRNRWVNGYNKAVGRHKKFGKKNVKGSHTETKKATKKPPKKQMATKKPLKKQKKKSA